MNTAVMKADRPCGKDAAGKRKAMDLGYTEHPPTATPNRMVVEKQLGWAVQTLHNPQIRPNERACLLLLAGSILIDFVGQQHLRSSR